MTDDENFNSHAHVERDVSFLWCRFKTPNFNSHAHVERDASHSKFLLKLRISTHTLTWSVTETALNTPYRIIISTHTLTWSVTQEAVR